MLGLCHRYIGLGVGVGRIKADDYVIATLPWETNGIGLAGQVGLGVKAVLGHNWQLDAGYRFKSIVNALMPGVAPGFAWNTSLATRNHVLQLGVTYDMNGAQVEPVAGMDPQTTRWYATLFGGAAWTADTLVARSTNFLTDYKNGFSAGAAIGTNILETVRGELEVSYLKVKGATSTLGGTTFPLPGSVKTSYVLANVWKDIKLGHGISPYLGAGLGLAFVDIDTDLCIGGSICPAQGNNVALAGQAGGGVRVNVANNVTLDVGYRFKAALDVLTDQKTPPVFHSMASYYHHVVQAGASVNF